MLDGLALEDLIPVGTLNKTLENTKCLGTIAALLRLKYPNITQGNIASSAPLQMVVDFWREFFNEFLYWRTQKSDLVSRNIFKNLL